MASRLRTKLKLAYIGLNRQLRRLSRAGHLAHLVVLSRSTKRMVGGSFTLHTQLAYDELGNEITQTDAAGHSTTFQYDAMGRRTGRTLPGRQSEGFCYDNVYGTGNLIYQTNFNGLVITNQYDVDNRLTNCSAPGYQAIYAYSQTGLRTSMVDASGTNSYAYDNLNRLVSKVAAWNGGPTVALNYRYDALGSLTNLWSSTAAGVTNVYQYDLLGRLSSVLASNSVAASYGYDLVGNLQGMRYANGVTNLYQYDARNRLTSLAWQSGGTALASFAYTVGPTGNRTSLTETVGSGATPRAYNWAYDYLYRMTGESIGGLGAVGYGFDTVGNRLSRSSNVSGISSNTAAYTANDWLTNDLANSLYDSDGNTTNSSGVAYRYDSLNHLTNVNNGQSIIITYDGDGNRVSKKVGSGTATYYLVDSVNPSGYAQVLEEYQGANLSRVYNYGLALISQRQATSGTVSYFGIDGHGSARFLMDVNGNVTDTYTFDAYGILIPSASSGSTPNNYLYCGQQWDGDLGMYCLRARYYQPNTGRFWSMDTYDGNSEDPLSLHKYLYGADNPVNMTDPSGNVPILSNWYYGQEVHDKIGEDFLATGTGRYYDRPISEILGVPWIPFLTASRPDLVQKPEFASPGQVYEIKPVSSFIQGQAQLQWYLFNLNFFDPQKQQWNAGYMSNYTPPTFISLGTGVFAIVSPPVRGVIVYQVEDLRASAFMLGVFLGAQINADVGIAVELNTMAPAM